MRRIFLHCVDSRVEENGSWYSRLHLGPFPTGLSTTLATALRRARLTDLPFVGVQAVEFEGAAHEYSRLAGIHEPVLDLLLRFRDLSIAGDPETFQGSEKRAFFNVRGPGVFRAADLRLPPGLTCVNPNLILANLAPGAHLRGRVLLEAVDQLKPDASPSFGENWLPVQTRTGPVRRVGFRIEDAGPLDQGGEVVIFEISTNGTLSPQQALRLASERRVRLFLGIVGRTSEPRARSEISMGQPLELLSQAESTQPLTLTSSKKQSLGGLTQKGYRRFADPLGLDLGNLDLSFQAYQFFRLQGVSTRGELVNWVSQENVPEESFLLEARKALLRYGVVSSS